MEFSKDEFGANLRALPELLDIGKSLPSFPVAYRFDVNAQRVCQIGLRISVFFPNLL